MTRALLLTILLCGGATASVASGAPPVRDASPCESETTSFDTRAVTCSIPAGGLQRYHLQVNFSGGHDDTMASMIPRLDGVSLKCEEGSKVRLMGEDGDVSLICVFSIPDRHADKHLFEASISFSHAQYVSYAFGPF